MDINEYSRFFLALAFVVALIWLCGYIMKRTGMDKRLRGVTGNHGRLAVVDVLYLNPKQKLTLVRADAREYLILVAGDRAHVIDSMEAKNHDEKPAQ